MILKPFVVTRKIHLYLPKTAQTWNDRVNNILETVQQDVYVWKVQLTDIFGKRHNYVGHVSVIR
ncbi:MAG: hypothetical protein J0M08_01405 [Bacteroidetes bacterium]|nr:hypothetical protein [Bacteroidota bacterium]